MPADYAISNLFAGGVRISPNRPIAVLEPGMETVAMVQPDEQLIRSHLRSSLARALLNLRKGRFVQDPDEGKLDMYNRAVRSLRQQLARGTE